MIVRDFRGDYCPAGQTTRARRRANARRNGRKGGLASGRRRRQIAQGRRRTRDGGLGVPAAYPYVPRISGVKLEARYRALCDAEGRRFHQGGYDTFAAVYAVLRRWYDVKGQGFEITNENVSHALRALGRPHSRRTVQYTRQRLERAALLACAHVKRSGPRRVRGQMDTIRIHLYRRSFKHCTPPLRGNTNPPSGRAVGVAAPRKEEERRRLNDSSPPPPAADDAGGSAAERHGTQQGEIERRIDFLTLKLQAGWNPHRCQLELARCHAELRAIAEPGSPRGARRDSDG